MELEDEQFESLTLFASKPKPDQNYEPFTSPYLEILKKEKEK